MSDNIAATPGIGTTLAFDDVAGVFHQRVKAEYGSDGSATDVDLTHGLPSRPAIAGIGDGNKTVATAGTRVALASSTACQTVVITALDTNTSTVVVGGSTVVAAAGSMRGLPLLPGDSVTLAINNLSDIYLDARVSGEGVSFGYLT